MQSMWYLKASANDPKRQRQVSHYWDSASWILIKWLKFQPQNSDAQYKPHTTVGRETSSSTLCAVPSLFVTPRDCSLQAPLSMEILQARILEWVTTPSFGGSSQPRDRTQVSCIAGGFFTIGATSVSPSMIYKEVSFSFKGLHWKGSISQSWMLPKFGLLISFTPNL